jgi:SagB-type dehydrogenase family enzyme
MLLSSLSPTPRPEIVPFEEFEYRLGEKTYLAKPSGLPAAPFEDVIASRRSRRRFGNLSVEDLGSLLWFAVKTRESRVSEEGVRWQHRPCPSAGGCHPVDILVIDQPPAMGGRRISLYDHIAHALTHLVVATSDLHEFVADVDEVLALNHATILWMVAQPARTFSKYEYGESLIWRDAGAILATIGIVAEALGLNYCAVGATGEPAISQLLASDGSLAGLGGCLVGSRN